MIRASYAYYYTLNRHAAGPSGRTTIDPDLLLPAESRLQKLAEVPGNRPVWAQDLLQIARAVYLADKLSPRASAEDRWTRHLDLTVQVADTALWTEPVLALLCRLTETLTADRWTISVQPGATAWPHQGTMFPSPRIEEVTLYSGGLDSTAHVAERSRASKADLLVVSYYEPHWGSRQDDVLDAIRTMSSRSIRQFKASQQVRGHRGTLEKSARSRGLLYAATAVCLAAAHGVPRVSVPENGQLALNPALTPSRVAACSTRSVHPYTVNLLNEIIRAVGGCVTVVNPFLHLTKGEVCARALSAGLSASTLTHQTLSCGRPPRDGSGLHCGRCYPCLVRHSGLLAALDDDDTPYANDVWTVPDSEDSVLDRRALHRWLSHPFGLRDLVTDLPPPDGLDLVPLIGVVQRGREELAAMFARHGRTVRQRHSGTFAAGMAGRSPGTTGP